MRIANVLSACSLVFWMGLLTIGATGDALSCGIDWRLPQSHFEGVDEQGHVLYCENIGVLDVGENLQVPLHIMFKSEWMANSPYLGKGWMLPLLESRIEQTSERYFRLWQPDGWYRDFWCSKSSETVLEGWGGWKAEIRGDTITAWASCGWKLVFAKNKLTAIVTPKNQRLDLAGRNGQVDEVLANGLRLLRVERDAMTGRVKGLTLRGEKRISIEQQLRPRVQQIGKQNVVKGEDYSLAKMTLADGTVRTYEYGVDDQVRPTLKMGDRLIVWDPVSNLIVKDGEWTYDIKSDKQNISANAAIGRNNGQGQTEFWHHDGANGREIVQGPDGARKITTWFSSGLLAGKTRNVKTLKNGKVIGSRTLSYDEKGRLVRQVEDEELFASYKYDDTGRVVEEEIVGLEKGSFHYLNDGAYEKTTLTSAGAKSIETFNKQGALVAGKYPDGKGLAAASKLAGDPVRGTIEVRDREVHKLTDQLDQIKDPIRRGDLLLQVARIYMNDTDWPGDLRAAVTIYEGILTDSSMDSLTKAQAHAWASSAYISLGHSETKNIRRHAEELLALNGDELPSDRKQSLQTEKTCAFRLILSLETQDNPMTIEKTGKMLLTKYGDTDAYKKQLNDILAYEKRELAKRYLRN